MRSRQIALFAALALLVGAMAPAVALGPPPTATVAPWSAPPPALDTTPEMRVVVRI